MGIQNVIFVLMYRIPLYRVQSPLINTLNPLNANRSHNRTAIRTQNRTRVNGPLKGGGHNFLENITAAQEIN
jgi:hypothetical protein